MLVQDTGIAVSSHMKEVNKALFLNNILTSENANEITLITLDLSACLKKEDAQGIRMSQGRNELPTLKLLPVNSITEKMNRKRKVDSLIDENCEQSKSKQSRKDDKNEESFKITFNLNSTLGFYCHTKKHRHRSYCVTF